jgi:hypothetical protein
MKPLIFALSVVSSLGGLIAQAPGWQPSPGHAQVQIGPAGPVPDELCASSSAKAIRVAIVSF